MFRSRIKTILRRLGVFPISRFLYRSFHPGIARGKKRETEFYGQFVQQGSLCFDIGCNLGQKAEIYLNCGATVVAVEPNPLCEPTIRFEHGNNSQFLLVQKAVGKKVSEQTLNFVGTSSTASMRADWPWLRSGDTGKVNSVQVEVTTLDAMIEEFGRPDYCKIDVEGYEEEVLAGLSSMLPLLSFEYHVEEMDKTLKCLNHLNDIGPFSARFMGINSHEWASDYWLSYTETKAFLVSNKCPPAGDLFVKHISN